MPAIAIDWSPSEQDPKYANAGFAQRHGLHPIGLPAARACLDNQHEIARQQMGTDQPMELATWPVRCRSAVFSLSKLTLLTEQLC